MSDTLGIVGDGAFARALGGLVAGRGRDVLLYSRRTVRDLPPRVRHTTVAMELARAARFVVLAVRSDRLRGELEALGGSLDGGHLVVHASGALLEGIGPVSRLIAAETCVKRIGAMAGPALARDLAEGKPAALVIASAYDEVMLVGQKLLTVPPALRVYRRRDLAGVELAAALSGVMTIAVGMADGMGLGAGPRALLVTRAVAEMARFGTAAGAGEGAFTGLAGLGSVLVRSQASSEQSEDYLLGRGLARGERDRRPSEGAHAAKVAEAMARQSSVRTPLLDAVVAVVWNNHSPADVMGRLTETDAPEE